MAKLAINKSQILLVLLAIFSALFFGLVSLTLVSLVGDKYAYLLALPLATLICLIFIFDRYMFFMLVILSRASLDVAFNAIKLGSFGLGAVLNALVILIALLTLLEKSRVQYQGLKTVRLAWTIFLTLAGCSLVYAPTILSSIKVFLLFVSYASMMMIGLHVVKNDADFGKWLKAIVYSSIIPALYGIYSMAFGGGGARLSLGEGFRVQSTFPHPNSYAFYLVLVISLTFYLYKTKVLISINPVIKRILPIYILVLVGLLIMTKTRSAWVACYLFFLLYGLFFERKFLFILFFMSVAALFIPDVQDRLLDLQKGTDFGASGYAKLNSYAWRKKYWADAINWMSKSHYLTGYGVSSFLHYSPEFGMANAFSKQNIEINAHSVYVQLFFELGILGVLSFIFLMYAHIKNLYAIYQKNKLLVFTAIVLFVEYLFESYSDNLLDYLIYNWYLWFFFGLAFAYVSKQDKEKVI